MTKGSIYQPSNVRRELKRAAELRVENKKLIKINEELFSALNKIVGVCQDSLEDHFGVAIGTQIRKAIKRGTK